jgi:hypothetical protein
MPDLDINYEAFIENCWEAYGDVNLDVLSLTKSDTTIASVPISTPPAFLFIPWQCIHTLRRARVSLAGVFVYLILWRLCRMRKQWTVPLSSAVLAPFGFDRWDKARALACLERVGLIQVVRQRGKNPLVTVCGEQDAPWMR